MPALKKRAAAKLHHSKAKPQRRPHGEAAQTVEAYIKKNGEITQPQVVNLLGYKHISSAANLLRKMMKKGLIEMKFVDGINRYHLTHEKSPANNPESVVKQDKQAPARVKKWVRFINDNPGTTVTDIIHAFGIEGTYVSTTVASALHNEVAEGNIRMAEQDGNMRFFAKDYDPSKVAQPKEETPAKVDGMTEGRAIDTLSEVLDGIYDSLGDETTERVVSYVTSRHAKRELVHA